MKKMFVTDLARTYKDGQLGIIVPETVKDVDAPGFAEGIEYVLMKLNDDWREQVNVIKCLGEDVIKYL